MTLNPNIGNRAGVGPARARRASTQLLPPLVTDRHGGVSVGLARAGGVQTRRGLLQATGPATVATVPGTALNGDAFYAAPSGTLQVMAGGVLGRQWWVFGIDATDSTAISGTANETDFDNAITLPAGFLTLGRIFRVTATGRYSGVGLSTLRLRLKAGSVTLIDLSTGSSAATNGGWRLNAVCSVTAIGSSGAIRTVTTGSGLGTTIQSAIATSGTVDTTVAQAIKVSGQWNTNNGSNTTTLEYLMLEAL